MPSASIKEQDFRSVAEQSLPWGSLAGKVVLVSGANGFLGSGIVDLLLRLNDTLNASNPARVIGIIRNPSRGATRFASSSGRKDLHLLT
ncbi:MAG TPA: hypothetical protein VIU29_08715, partial [Candidatus Deferrimicrobiaceae bacterium]